MNSPMDVVDKGTVAASDGSTTTRGAWGDRDEGSEVKGMVVDVTEQKIVPVERVTDETGGDHVPISGDKTNNNSNNNGPFDGFLLKGMSIRPGRKGTDIISPALAQVYRGKGKESS